MSEKHGEVILSDLKFNGYRILKVEYKNYKTPRGTPQYEINFENTPFKLEETKKAASLVLQMKLKGSIDGELTTEMAVTIEGKFSTDTMEIDNFLKTTLVGGMATLVTLLRSFVASFTSQTGYNPIILPLINVQATIDKATSNTSQENSAAESDT